MAAMGQTITIVNKSGKIVNTSKHIVNVFNEAKSAYNERKAELKALRRKGTVNKSEERKARKQLEALALEDDDNVSSTSSRRSSRRGSEDGRSSRRKPNGSQSSSRRDRPPIERGVSDSFYTNDAPSNTRRGSHRPSPLRQESHGDDFDPRIGELTRRHTDNLRLERRDSHRPEPAPRRRSADDIDMDLAYGELPPPLPERKYDTEIELRAKMSGLQRLLDEANCLQHSVTATIDNLQKNPDALAAVALTLAEISNLATKMAPGALASMKGAFPTIIALLASPEFAIAIGVGVGVTVIAFGGYKIIKKIKARKEQGNGNLIEGARDADEVDGLDYGPPTPETEMDTLREISGIELWRRGIADVEAESAGTSVDGEFITPIATKTLIEEGKLTEGDLKSTTESDGKKKRRRHHSSSKSEKDGKSRTSSRTKTKVKAEKEPSGIRMLFKRAS